MNFLIQILFFLFLTTKFCIAQWYQQNSGTNYNFSTVQFIDTTTGWIVGTAGNYPNTNGIILKTTDGGENWTLQNNIGITNYLFSVYFIDSNTGWAVGWYEGQNFAGTIYKTTDGGTTWIKTNSNTTLLFL